VPEKVLQASDMGINHQKMGCVSRGAYITPRIGWWFFVLAMHIPEVQTHTAWTYFSKREK
jgi:hypothetical protein